VSDNNGIIDWSRVNANFAITRVGYGRTIDKKFSINWAASKGKNNRSPYWYLDYYSNWYVIPDSSFVSSARGLTDEQWGEEQADNCWNELKNDPEGIVWADVENGGHSYSPPLTDLEAKNHALRILRAFLKRIDELNNKVNGIYGSIGWLSWFWSEFRDRPLFVAWYNEFVTVDDVIYTCKKNGWIGDVLIWQYASDGDVDDDGIADGKTYFYSTEKFMDLDAWIGTAAQYAEMFGTVTTPDDETSPIPTANTRIVEVKTTLARMNVRTSPKIGWNIFKTIEPGIKVDCLEKIIDGSNIWQRVGISQYVAEFYNGIQYLK